jgi:hypothetical protein
MTVISSYVYLWGLENPVYPFVSLRQLSKLTSSLTGAFVIGSSQTNLNIEVLNAIPEITEWIKSGKEFRLSFGGANGPYIQESLDLQKQITVVSDFLKKTGCRYIDFDVEGHYIKDDNITTQIVSLCSELQKVFPDLKVSLTVAVNYPSKWDPNTFLSDQLNFIKKAASQIKLDKICGMTMDFYNPDATKDMGEACILVSETMHKQLSVIFPELSKEQVYDLIGIVFMAGVNDDNSVFTLDHAKKVRDYSISKGVGLLSFWAINRDNGDKRSLPISSMITQESFDFIKTISDFPSDPKPVPVPVLDPIKPISGPKEFVSFEDYVEYLGKKTKIKLFWKSGKYLLEIEAIGSEETSSETKGPKDPKEPKGPLEPWKTETKYSMDQIVSFDGQTFICQISHTSQDNWTPKNVPALWKKEIK